MQENVKSEKDSQNVMNSSDYSHLMKIPSRLVIKNIPGDLSDEKIIEIFQKNFDENDIKKDMIAVAIYRNENLKISDEDYSFYTSYLDNYYGCTKSEETIELLGSEEIYNAQVIYFYVLDYIMDNATKQ